MADIEKQSTELVQVANDIAIANDQEYKGATDLLKQIKSLQKEIKASFDPIITKAHQAHKEAIAQRDKILNPVVSAEKTVKGKVSAYAAELEKARIAEQKRLEAEAEKKRQTEIEKAIEANEIAEQLALEGDIKGAAEIQQEAKEIADNASKIEAEKVYKKKVDGISYRDDWEIEITEPLKVPRQFCIPDEKAIRAFVKATKGKQPIFGVKITHKKITSVKV